MRFRLKRVKTAFEDWSMGETFWQLMCLFVGENFQLSFVDWMPAEWEFKFELLTNWRESSFRKYLKMNGKLMGRDEQVQSDDWHSW